MLSRLHQVLDGIRRALASEPPASGNSEPGTAPSQPIDPYAGIKEVNSGLRSTAKWMLASFGAVGALVLGGIPFSNVGNLDSLDARAVATVAGLALALLGIALAIWFTSSVLAPFTNSFDSLERHRDIAVRTMADRDVALGMTYPDLRDAVLELDRRLSEASDDDYDRLAAERMDLEPAKQAALTVIGSAVLAQSFRRARVAVVAGAALAVTGAALFAWGANPANKPAAAAAETPLAQQPVVLAVHLSNKGTHALAESRGCSTADLRALTIGGDTQAWEIVTIPDGHCKSVRLVLTTDVGTAVAAAR